MHREEGSHLGHKGRSLWENLLCAQHDLGRPASRTVRNMSVAEAPRLVFRYVVQDDGPQAAPALWHPQA